MTTGGDAVRVPLQEDVANRLRADRSSRRPVLLCFATAIAWLLLGSVLGELASLKLHLPDLLVSQPWLTFGRVRPAHLNAMIYGWASLAMLGVSLWMIPRLVHTDLHWAPLAEAGVWLWNVGAVLGVGGILLGFTDGLEWLEMHRWAADPWLVIGGGLVGMSLLRTLAARDVDHLYVSVWYIMGAFLWFPVIFLIGNGSWRGVESAGANWFYAHNALGLWLTAVCLGAAYYFIPKVLGRPIYSYQLSLLGFWSLAFFYSLNGMHHLIGGPMPTWMITTSVVASVLMLIPVLAVAINHHMTMVGRFRALRYSPTLRFVVLGAIAYTAVSLQGMFTALREVNRVTHFTHWTIAHAHVGVYSFVTFVLFGSVYYILPRLVGHEWPSARLIRWHFWSVLGGIALYVIPLTVFGVMQGLALSDPAIPFEESVRVSIPGLVVRSIAGLVLTFGHVVFAWNVVRMLRHRPEAVRAPVWQDVDPIVYRVEPAS
ncbi:MAG: cbb3-type cytochrome c oxidase subunit I [Gemmatimonadetes bacterium]|nr:cbb3-type cytochrome c oxidase subunit I [Gemmatimonadota bacterium]